ncbi:MAG: hypothetical protein U9N47_03750 [Thermodesulfobacteriota bacterium]|nr:hypothetical protein [Thermodesulfobacteriota bacterium]
MTKLLYEDLSYKIIGAALEHWKYIKTVENMAIKKITNQNEAQLINYFKTTRLRICLLIIQSNSVKIRGELLWMA